MGNNSRPGSVVTREIPHPAFTVDGETFYVLELHWNGTDSRSYEVILDVEGGTVLTDTAFDTYPTDDQIAAVLAKSGRSGDIERPPTT